MTVYTDEIYYQIEYLCGKEPCIKSAFEFYARQATAEIKKFTGENIDEDNIPNCVKSCCCELAETLYLHEKSTADSNGKASESVGGWSVSYENSEQSEQAFKSKVKKVIYKWLSGTNLLYRGIL